MYTVTQTAKILDTSAATVRRLADEMSDILPDYQHSQGAARQFTEDDVRTLSALHTRLQANPGQTRTDLLRELSQPDSEPLIIPETLPTAKPSKPQEAPESPKARIAIQTDLDSPQSALAPFLQAQNETRQQVASLSAQIAEIARREAQLPQRDRRLAITVSVCFLVLLIGVMVSALYPSSPATLLASVTALVVLSVALVWPILRR